MDYQEVGAEHVVWIGMGDDRDTWWALVSTVMNILVPQSKGNILKQYRSCEWVSDWVYNRIFMCYRCPVDDKLISRFRGSWSETGVFETQVFAYMKTFRFTGSPALYIECDVRMCHGRCPVSISQILHHVYQRDVMCQNYTSDVWGLRFATPADVITGFLYFSFICILWNI